jgi:hypothetical protein
LVEKIRPSIKSSDSKIRQAAVDELFAWAKTETSLGIDWKRVYEVKYGRATYGACKEVQKGSRDKEMGSCTDASNPMKMTVWIGPEAFFSVSGLYSTFRHELVHVKQHHDHKKAISQGIGIKEVYAYLWELENAKNTGLALRKNWGLRPDGTVNETVGLARVVQGLMHAAIKMGEELSKNPKLIPPGEVKALQKRVACALLTVPKKVMRGFPYLNPKELKSACSGKSQGKGNKRGGGQK